MDEWMSICCLYTRIKSVVYIFKVTQKDMVEEPWPVNLMLIIAETNVI